jgi:hypothetical protein
VSAPGAALAPAAARQGSGERRLWLFLAPTVLLILATAALRVQANPILGAIVVGLVLVSYQQLLLSWQTMMGAILLVILFIPIRRYEVGSGLPVQLEPYRLLIAVVLACWFCALAADRTVRWRKTRLEAPVVALVLAILLSMMVNIGAVNALGSVVVKQVTFFASYVLVLYFISSVLVSTGQLDRMLRLLVGGGTLLAVLALIEWRTGTNLFNWYGRVMPFLHYVDLGETVNRGSGIRAMGSAQHPIALGAALVMLIPITVYLRQREGKRIWFVCCGLLTLGALSTGSRTAALMLIVLLVVFVCIKPTETIRLIPMLVPLAIVIQIVMPGTLGTFRAILQPSYIIKEQSTTIGTGSGRIADLGPALEEWAQKPLLGGGFGTRATSQGLGQGGVGSLDDAQILDNQWLGWLLSVGAIGVMSLAWLFGRAIRLLGRMARARPGPDGWLATSLAAALGSFAIGMFTFDAFAFIQVTFFAFIMLGFAAAALRDQPPSAAT